MTLSTARPGHGEIDHELLWGWVILTTGALAVWIVAGGLVPALVCPFRALTGLPCPTCGATRAFAALVRGDLAASVRLHPLVAPGAALAVAYVPYALVAAHASLPRVRVRLTARDWTVIRVGAAALATAVWSYLIAAGR